MNKLAIKYPRWGYRSITRLLRDDGWKINAKRIGRLWRLEGRRVPPSKAKKSGQKALGGSENSSRRRPARGVNDVWCYDFVSAKVRRGGPIRILNVVDELTRVSLGSRVSRSIGATAVVAHLEKLFEAHGVPSAIRSDNGREFIASTVITWNGNRQTSGGGSRYRLWLDRPCKRVLPTAGTARNEQDLSSSGSYRD